MGIHLLSMLLSHNRDKMLGQENVNTWSGLLALRSRRCKDILNRVHIFLEKTFLNTVTGFNQEQDFKIYYFPND